MNPYLIGAIVSAGFYIALWRKGDEDLIFGLALISLFSWVGVIAQIVYVAEKKEISAINGKRDNSTKESV